MEEKKKRGFKMPHVFVLLMMIILVCAILSYIVPAGQYSRVHIDPADETSRLIIDHDSFEYIDRTPIGIMTLLSSLAGGMAQAADIIFFIFIVGGSIAILQKSGALEGAMITDEEEAIRRCIRMVTEGKVTSHSGKELDIKGDTLCVHGDGPKAIAFVQRISKAFIDAGIEIRAV